MLRSWRRDHGLARQLGPGIEARCAMIGSANLLRSAAISGVVRLSVSEFLGVIVVPAMLTIRAHRYPCLEIVLELGNEMAELLNQQVDPRQDGSGGPDRADHPEGSDGPPLAKCTRRKSGIVLLSVPPPASAHCLTSNG